MPAPVHSDHDVLCAPAMLVTNRQTSHLKSCVQRSLALLLVLLLLGCRGGPISAEDRRGNVFVELWASRSCADYGETVTLRATATNRDSRPLVVELKDQPVLDIIVGYPDQVRWSTGKPLTSDQTRLELKPGESKTIELQWVATGPSGATAHFIDNARYPENPVDPNFFIYVGNCPGLLGGP